MQNLFQNLSQKEQESLLADQIELELKLLDMGVTRYRKWRQDADPSRGTPEMRLIGSALDAVVEGIEAAKDMVVEKKAAQGQAHWGYPFFSLGSEKLAVLALVTLINLADKPESTMEMMCKTIGTHVEQEYQFETLKKDHKKLFDVIRKKVKNWTPRQVQYMRRKVDAVDRRWPLRVRYWVGAKLIEIILDNTNLFERVRYTTSKWRQVRKMSKLALRPEVREELDKQHDDQGLIRPYYLPMVVPPRDWSTTAGDGGFVYHRLPLVKPQNLTDKPTEYPEVGPIVYQAINLVQRSGYRINKRVLEVMQQVWMAGGGWAGLPLSNPMDLPHKPEDIDTNPASLSEYKQQARLVYDHNNKTIAKRKSALTKLRTAAAYADTPEFFFPWQLDYRGRMYPVSGDLHPQSDDVARGLLQASIGKPLGEEGYQWLWVKLANHFGMDKVSFRDRRRWVQDNRKLWLWIAEDPLNCKDWAEADDPWQALATIFEFAEALRHPEGSSNYRSHLTVHKDGSCNGLQHFAAMGLDPAAALAVNLIPGSEPADIYEQVSSEVVRIVDGDRQRIPICAEDFHPCHEWADRIDRKTVKRAAMTLPYGVTLEGMASQFITDGHCNDMAKPRSCAVYLRDITWDVLEATVPAARRIMDWLKKCSSKTAKKDVALQWTTPAGFPVIQQALEYTKAAIYTVLQRVHIHAANDEGRISTHRQNRCMPPNFVHSMDAAHLMLTIVDAARKGVTHFNMVHDSFGCHACDVPLMDASLRDQFVRMYAFDDILRRYKLQWERQSGVQLPDPPERGDLDLTQVYSSEYFFA
jgi:DNA-directed RNA polymerase